MNLCTESFVADFAGILTTALMHLVWQAAVLSLTLVLAVKLFAIRTAQHRYLLSIGTLLAMGIAPFLTALLCLNSISAPGVSGVDVSVQSSLINGTPSAAVAQTKSATPNPDDIALKQTVVSIFGWTGQVQFAVLIAWLAGVLVLSTRLAIGFGVSLWIRRNLQPLSDKFEQRVRILGDSLRIDARNRVFVCMRVGQAVAVGFIRPVVLIPSAWLTQLSPEMLEAVIAHELAHIRRWDLWVNLIQRVIETLLFYHPAVWWLSRRIRLEREMCCDEIAAGCFDRALYARSLESVARIARGNLLLAASINGGKKMNLLSRIQYLLGMSPFEASGNWWAVGFVALLLPFAGMVAFSSTAGTAPSVAIADESLDESTAAQKIELLGGKITRDETLPGHPVVGVVIAWDHTFKNQSVQMLKAFKHLTSLRFWNVDITDQSMQDLRDCKNLEVLEIGYNNGPSKFIGQIDTRITDVGLKELSGLKHLKRLYLDSARITDDGLKVFSELTDLTDLTLSAAKITDVGLKELKFLKHLSVLNLGGCKEITDAGLKELSGLKQLTDLGLTGTRITDAGLKELRGFKHLKSLDLSFDRIKGTGLKELSESHDLTNLNLTGTMVTDVGLKELGEHQNLVFLGLNHLTEITDQSIQQLKQFTKLKTLYIFRTQITDQGIKELHEALPGLMISGG